MSFSQQLNTLINSFFGATPTQITTTTTQPNQNIDDTIDNLTEIMNHNNITTPPVLGDQDCYLVDELLDSRINEQGQTEYLVKWNNDKFEPSWEPIENINPSLIRNFLLSQEVKQHNIKVTQKNTQSRGTQLPSAHLYLRVSDPSKTSSLFKKSTITPSTNNTNSTNQGQGQGQYQPQGQTSYQAYFSAFPAGNFSIESQKEILLNYCFENNFLVSSIEMDDGVSARNPDKLQGLQKIINRINPHETLLVLDLSRFSRNSEIGLKILEDLNQRKVRIYSVLDGMNYDTPASRHCVRTTISCAQLESDIKSMKLKASIQNIRSKGGYIGSRAPYGYKIVREGTLRKLIKNQSEQNVIDIISSLNQTGIQIKGNKFGIIADKLNEKGLRNRGKFFTKQAVKYIHRKFINNKPAHTPAFTPTPQTPQTPQTYEMNVDDQESKNSKYKCVNNKPYRFLRNQVETSEMLF